MEPKDKAPAPWLTHTYGDTEWAWTGIQGPKHYGMLSTQAQSRWQMCTWRQLCHLHTLALTEHVGPVLNSRASLSTFFKTSFITACPLLSICLNDLWTPGTKDVPFCSKPTIQTPLFPPSSGGFESLPCCLWTEIRKKHFGTHDAGRSGAGIAFFWVVCCFNNVTPPPPSEPSSSNALPCTPPVSLLSLSKSFRPPLIYFTPRHAITSCTKRTK